MKAKLITVKKDFDRDLYWARIEFNNDRDTKKGFVYAAASEEYLADYFKINSKQINDTHLKSWIDKIIKKWSGLGNNFFKEKVHYDVYANTKVSEANCVDFLVKNIK